VARRRGINGTAGAALARLAGVDRQPAPVDVARAIGAAWPGALDHRWERLLDAVIGGGAAGVASVYQPIARIRDREVLGYEALARFDDARTAGVEGVFAAAQRAGREGDLDWMCRRAAFEGAQSLAAGTPLFVNIEVRTLLDPMHPVDQTLLLLEYTKRSSRDVVLELTERDVISDLSRLVTVLAQYRAEGFRFAIDDLGEGHSTLELLAQARPEYIKLASRLTAATGHHGVEAVVSGVVAFAERTGATVIAECIESAAQADFLVGVGVEVGQGWWLGPPGALPVGVARLRDPASARSR
jgi:EAL domain-containing protein (putative c-di-GMP-specific phosphodiesterase class I)